MAAARSGTTATTAVVMDPMMTAAVMAAMMTAAAMTAIATAMVAVVAMATVIAAMVTAMTAVALMATAIAAATMHNNHLIGGQDGGADEDPMDGGRGALPPQTCIENR
jgi:hypothetical protein